MDSVMRTLLVLSAWLCVQGRLDVRKEGQVHDEDFHQSGRIPTTTCLPLLNQGYIIVIGIGVQLRILISTQTNEEFILLFSSNTLILIHRRIFSSIVM